jgi:YHS domain-containing protein
MYPRVRYADSLVSLNDRCIVRQAPLNALFKASYVNGKPIGFCCRTCPATFAQDPEPYLRAQRIQVPCAVFPAKRARIDSSLRRVIGHDLFYFSSSTAMQLFDRDPLRYVKKLSDPITNDRFRVTRRSPREEYRNRTYYFASEGEKSLFDSDRAKYRDRRADTWLELEP